jgi:hypothetical protein
VLTGITARGADSTRTLAKLGDSLPALAWGDTGRVVVSGLVPQHELRVAWEPNNASYFSSRRVVLTPSAEGTLVEYTVRYTDERAEADQNASRAFGETLRAVTSFKALAEKK